MLGIPGRSYRGPLPPLTAAEKDLSKKLSDHVSMLAGEIGARSLTGAPDNLETAASYIEHTFQSYGCTVERQEFSADTLSFEKRQVTGASVKFPTVSYKTRNVIAEIKGTIAPEQIVIVGAHYDSVYDCPAANDNASGVAAMLEIMGAMRNLPPARTVRFVAFTNEEPPFFQTEQMGSYRYARRCRDHNERIVAMLCLETIGYYTDDPGTQSFPHPLFGLVFPTTGNFVSFVSNVQSHSMLKKCIGTFRKAVQFPSEGMALPEQIPGVNFSDQYYFWKFGYPAVMVTDTAFYRYPYYHQATDTPDKIDYEKFCRVVCGLAAVVNDLCSVS